MAWIDAAAGVLVTEDIGHVQVDGVANARCHPLQLLPTFP